MECFNSLVFCLQAKLAAYARVDKDKLRPYQQTLD